MTTYQNKFLYVVGICMYCGQEMFRNRLNKIEESENSLTAEEKEQLRRRREQREEKLKSGGDAKSEVQAAIERARSKSAGPDKEGDR